MPDASKTLTLILTSQAQSAIHGLGQVQSGLSGVASQARGLILPASFAAAAYMAQREVKKLIDEMDRVNDGKNRLGTTAEDYQRIAFATKLAGASAEALEPAFQRMNATIYGADEEGKAAQETLNKLGLTVEWLKGLSPEQRFAAIAKSLRQVSDDTERATLAQRLFGRGSAISLKPLIDDYENLIGQLDEVGGVIDGKVIDAADRFNDSLLKISTCLKGVVTESGLVEWLANVAGSFEEIAKARALNVDKRTLSPEEKMAKNTGYWTEFLTGMNESTASWISPLNWIAQGAQKVGALPDANPEYYSPSLMPDVEKRGNQKYLQEQARLLNDAKNEKERQEEEARLNAMPMGPFISPEQLKALREASEAEDKARAHLAANLEDMKLKLNMQNLINSGKEKEAFIMQELARAKPDGRLLSEDETRQIADAAAKLYDAKTAKDSKAAEPGIFNDSPDVDRFSRLGLYNFNFGGMRDTKTLDVQRNKLLEKIAEKIGIPMERTVLA